MQQKAPVVEAFTLAALPQDFIKELRQDGGAVVLCLLSEAHKRSLASPVDWQELKRYAELAHDRAWERLHCGSWKSVAGVWRRAFGYACVFRAQYLASNGEMKESLRMLDMCLMMAGPYAVDQVHKMITAVGREIQPTTEEDDHVQTKRRRLEESGSEQLIPTTSPRSLRFPIARVHLPSLKHFQDHFMSTNTPVIITGAMDEWPAMGKVDSRRSWHSLDYFRRVCGYRTVPIEIGSSYLEDDWGQQLMTMNAFIDTFLDRKHSSSAHRIGYLAQHHLFDQIPVLGRDIITPDYCALDRDNDGEDDDDDVAVNAWFGPKGTVSPLHFDPKDNLLCQVVGAKYLRLYAPTESDKLYPVDGLLSNTSQMNVEDPDLDKFPLVADAAFIECELQAGEMLYIPHRYWHLVRSLSTSFSVSFWWG